VRYALKNITKTIIMKKNIILTVFFITGVIFIAKSQDILAGWTFPTGTVSDANPDFHNTNNTSMTITTSGGTSAILWNKNGIQTYAAQATGWDGGANLKYWQIEVNTLGYDNLLLSSMQVAGAGNPGPRDWKAQYKVGASGTWTDIPGTTMVNGNNWEAVLHKVSIPSACNNQSSVFLRWIMTSDTSISYPALVQPTGTSKIDSIFIFGSQSSTNTEDTEYNFIEIFPNPAIDYVYINSDIALKEIELYNWSGIKVKKMQILENSSIVDLSGLPKGIYILRIITDYYERPLLRKIIVQ